MQTRRAFFSFSFTPAADECHTASSGIGAGTLLKMTWLSLSPFWVMPARKGSPSLSDTPEFPGECSSFSANPEGSFSFAQMEELGNHRDQTGLEPVLLAKRSPPKAQHPPAPTISGHTDLCSWLTVTHILKLSYSNPNPAAGAGWWLYYYYF